MKDRGRVAFMSTKSSIRWGKGFHLYTDLVDPVPGDGVYLCIDEGLCKAVNIESTGGGQVVTIRLPPEIAPILHPDVRRELRARFRRPSRKELAVHHRSLERLLARSKRAARRRKEERGKTPLSEFKGVWRRMPRSLVMEIDRWRQEVRRSDPDQAEEILRWFEGHTPSTPPSPEEAARRRRWREKIDRDLKRREKKERRERRKPWAW